MARPPQSTAFAYDEEFGSRKTWRLAIWAAIATAAIVIAVIAAFIDSGSRRAARAPDQGRQPVATAGTPASTFDAEMEARRLAEAVRLLAADRDRLMARINALERNLSDVTGSIGPTAGRPAGSNGPPMLSPAPAAGAAAPQPGALPPIAAPATRPAPPAAVPHPAQEPADRLASPPAVDTGPTGSVGTRTDFGVDLGSAASVEGLRALWATVRGSNEALFEGLRPVVAIREGAKPGAVELRLVAGPLSNAGAAARLCATLAAAAGSACQPAIFDGQRLALK